MDPAKTDCNFFLTNSCTKVLFSPNRTLFPSFFHCLCHLISSVRLYRYTFQKENLLASSQQLFPILQGDACHYRHNPAVLSNPVICKFWLAQGCWNVACPFRHPQVRSSTLSPRPHLSLSIFPIPFLSLLLFLY